MIKVLYFTHPYQDYLADGLLHGLKSLQEVKVYDYPPKNILYKSGKSDIGITGNAMTLYHLLDEEKINRFDLFYPLKFDSYTEKYDELSNKKYDLVIFSNICNQWGYYLQFFPHLMKKNTIIIDGEDNPAIFPYYGYFWRHHFWQIIPRPHKRFKYFKREWTPDTKFYRYYKLVPKSLLKFFPEPRNLHKISFSIPEEKIISKLPVKTKLFPRHIVDSEVSGNIPGSINRNVFKYEEDYYKDIQASKFGITTKRSGWDCLRHYEIAANGTVICFKDLNNKPKTCAPHGLIPGVNCISYKNYADLIYQTSNISDEQYKKLQINCITWVRNNTTAVMASRLIKLQSNTL